MSETDPLKLSPAYPSWGLKRPATKPTLDPGSQWIQLGSKLVDKKKRQKMRLVPFYLGFALYQDEGYTMVYWKYEV